MKSCLAGRHFRPAALFEDKNRMIPHPHVTHIKLQAVGLYDGQPTVTVKERVREGKTSLLLRDKGWANGMFKSTGRLHSLKVKDRTGREWMSNAQLFSKCPSSHFLSSYLFFCLALLSLFCFVLSLLSRDFEIVFLNVQLEPKYIYYSWCLKYIYYSLPSG